MTHGQAKRAELKKRIAGAKGYGEKVTKVMREYKHGELHSGSKQGPKVKDRKQAVAIALSEARKNSEREA